MHVFWASFLHSDILILWFSKIIKFLATWHVGSLFPKQGLNPHPPALEVWRLNHWTAREVPNDGGFLNPFFPFASSGDCDSDPVAQSISPPPLPTSPPLPFSPLQGPQGWIGAGRAIVLDHSGPHMPIFQPRPWRKNQTRPQKYFRYFLHLFSSLTFCSGWFELVIFLSFVQTRPE